MASTGTSTTLTVPMLDLSAQYAQIRDEIRAALDEVLQSQHFILGPQVQALEEEVARFCGHRFGVGVASGTDALILSLHAIGIGPGDEVILPSFTFIATADTVSLLGAKPVFVDIDPHTFTLDPAKIEEAITSKTRAFIPVHLYGQSSDMDPILEIAHRHNIEIIEDNAQAIGASYKSRPTGSMGIMGCLSFFPSKNLGGYGDGGMIVTDSEDIYRRLRSLRSHGSKKKYFSEEQGWNSRLDELQAAVLRVKLRYLRAWNEARRTNAARYTALLENVEQVTAPRIAPWGEHVFHQYTIRIPNRDRVQKRLQEHGISTMIYYPVPIHEQPIYGSLPSSPAKLTESSRAAEEVLSLPMYPELETEQAEYVVESLIRALESR